MGPLSMHYRESLISLRSLVNEELDRERPAPEEFIEKFEHKSEQVKTCASDLIREGKK